MSHHGVIVAISVLLSTMLCRSNAERKNDGAFVSHGNAQPLPVGNESDLYSICRGLRRISLSVVLPNGDTSRTFDVQFFGKDTFISCALQDKTTKAKHGAVLLPEQITALNNAIRNALATTKSGDSADDLLTWERREGNTRKKYEFSINIGSDPAVLAVFDRVVELSNLPQYDVEPGDTLMSIAQDVLGDSERWEEIRDVNPYLHEDGRNLNPAFSIRVPRKGGHSDQSPRTYPSKTANGLAGNAQE